MNCHLLEYDRIRASISPQEVWSDCTSMLGLVKHAISYLICKMRHA